MGIIAWIILGLAAGLAANMLIPGKRSQGLILTCVIGIAGALGGGWAATRLFHVHSLQGFFNLSTWLTAIVGAAVLLLASRLITGRAPPDGTPMSRATGPRPPAGGRRAMRTGTGIFLITSGAVLRFALAGGSPHGLNVHIVGVILILAGGLGLLLPQVARAAPRDRLRRWVRPDQPMAYDEPPTADQGPDGNAPALVQDHSMSGR